MLGAPFAIPRPGEVHAGPCAPPLRMNEALAGAVTRVAPKGG